MIQKGFLKKKLEIKDIGIERFWIGIISGFLIANSLWLLVMFYREFARYFTILTGDLMIVPKKDFIFYNYFFSTISVLFGFGFTKWIWYSSIKKPNRKNFRIRHALNDSNLVTWSQISIIGRWGTLIPIVLYWCYSSLYSKFNILNDFRILFFLIPVIIFSQQWYIIRRAYYVGKWILISVIIIIVFSSFLGTFVKIDQNIINNKYFDNEFYHFIDQELDSAKKYGITFNSKTIEILKQNDSEESGIQMIDIQKAFSKKQKISLDTLILERIIIHNMKLYYDFKIDSLDRIWNYAYPEYIYQQIHLYDEIDTKEVEILFEMLNDLITQFNAFEILKNQTEIKSFEDFTEYQDRMFSNFEYNLKYNTKTILSRLIQVVDDLKNDAKYEKYHYLLIDINMDALRSDRQIYKKLNLKQYQ